MKEKIYTIPVNEAFDNPGECAFCRLNNKLEADILDYVLGPSYMEEDNRAETDRLGFCKHHYDKLFHAQNRLGVALMLSTHLKKVKAELDDVFTREAESGGRKGIFKKAETNPLADYSSKLLASCFACERIKARMDSYIETFFYLWKKEHEFKEKVLSGNGFCIEHLSVLFAEAHKRFGDKEFNDFVDLIIPLQKKNLERIDEELEWFIQKFDYRFKDEPWKNSKDSVERAILKLSALSME